MLDRSEHAMSEICFSAVTNAAHFVNLWLDQKNASQLSLGIHFFVIHVGIILMLISTLSLVSVVGAAIIQVLGSSMWIRGLVFIIMPTIIAFVPTGQNNFAITRLRVVFFGGLMRSYLVLLATIRKGLAELAPVREIHRD
jgi:hypothetical protein